MRPGENWSGLAARIAPGDEIVLLPGEHRGASLGGLCGSAELPIVVRGLDAERPATIAAENAGLLLQSPRHVILQDLVVVGARQNGINIDDQGGSGAIGSPWEAGVTLRRVTVLRTGPAGNTDGIKLSGLRGVRLEDCRVEGWGGSAVDMVGCHDVVIEGCWFGGLEGHAQASGVQAKGGSRGVRIVGCRFEDAGMRAVNLGGSTGLGYFRPPVPADAEAGSWYEAGDVAVERCIFVGGECAVAIVGARGAEVRDCTIVRPRRWAFRLLQETTDPRFGPSEGALVTGCIIVAESVRTPVNIGPGTRADGFRFGANLWWAPGLQASELELPGEVRGPQVALEPGLDEEHRPSVPVATAYGAHR